MNFLNAQEYDDLYYDPRSDTEKANDPRESKSNKSDYEKYIESLEQQADNKKSDSISQSKSLNNEEYNAADEISYRPLYRSLRAAEGDRFLLPVPR
jgi:hypothetical protein